MGNNPKRSFDETFNREQLKKNLKKKSLIGAVSKLTANSTSTALTLISTIVLARLLTPKEFGLIAMVTAFTEFARSFREIGLGSATVQKEKTTHEEVSTLFWINFGIGALIMILLMCLSPFLAWFYKDPRLPPICIALSTVFFFSGLSVQHRALLERQMKFHYTGAINVICSVLSIGIAILLAIRGLSVWALVFRDITFSIFYAIGLWSVCGWVPGFPNRKTNVRSSLRFGAELSGYEIIQYITRSLDQILIGRFCGAAALGLYTRALQLAMMPIEQIRMIFWDVGFSPMSALCREPERYRSYYSRLLTIMTFIYMPLVAFIAIESENVVRLVLGEKWIGAAPLVRIFAIAGFIRPIVGTFQLVMISCALTKRCVAWGTVNAFCLIIAYSIGIVWGSKGIAFGYSSASYALLLWSLFFCFKNTPINVKLVYNAISMPMLSSISAGIILIVFQHSIAIPNLPINITLSVLVISLSYLGVNACFPRGRENLVEFWSYRQEILKKK